LSDERADEVSRRNGDGLPEFVVYAGAVRSGNHSGPIWVYSQTPKGYKQLLSHFIYIDQDFLPMRTKTNGYLDFQFKGGATGTTIFKYNGAKYRPMK